MKNFTAEYFFAFLNWKKLKRKIPVTAGLSGKIRPENPAGFRKKIW